MKNNDSKQFEHDFNCDQVQQLLFLYVLDSGDLTLDERLAIQDHINHCPACHNEHSQTQLANDALFANSDWLVAEGLFQQAAHQSAQLDFDASKADLLQFQAKMARAIARRKKAEAKARKVRLAPYIRAASAVAACLLIVSALWWTIGTLRPDRSITSQPIAAKPHISSVKIELLLDTGAVLIPAGQLIAATNELKALRINGNREMTLNTGTQLSIVPNNLGCVVKLSEGEIYTHVEHDGKPFIVETSHGRAVITGTTFNIKTDGEKMELAVVEGTVRFESSKGSVSVTAGHKSLLASNNNPTMPVLCDAGHLTAWATGLDNTQELVTAANYLPEFDLYPTFDSEPIDLEAIDHDSWVDEKRNWFKREFPRIFRFKEALAKECIEVGYAELLIKSGDVWRFACPERSSTQLVSVSDESLLKLAAGYGKDEQWLVSCVGAMGKFDPAAQTSLEALGKWAGSVNGCAMQLSDDLLLYSLHASVYLAETRTLGWLAVKNDLAAVNASDKAELLGLLEKEVEAAYSCVAQIKRLFVGDCTGNTCDKSQQQKSLQGVAENIEEIAQIEREVAEYEIISK